MIRASKLRRSLTQMLFFLLLLLSAVLHFFGIQCTVTTTQKKKAGLVLHSYTHAKKKKRCVGAFFYICQTSDLSVGQPILSSLFFSSTFFLCVLSILRRFYSTTQDNTCTYFRPDFLKEATLCLYSLSQLVISKYTTAIVFSLLFFFPFPPSLS